MSSEGYCLPFREKRDSVTSSSNTICTTSPNGQYDNLNLNHQSHHHQSSNQSFTSSLKNVKNESNKFDYTNIESQQITPSKIHDTSNKSFSSIFERNELKKDDDKNISSKIDPTTTINKSTLSLHIAAYENAISSPTATTETINNESFNSEGGGTNNGLKMNIDKRLNKSTDKDLLSSSSTSTTEFPRQQKSDSCNEMEPEIAKFKTSQKLLFSRNEMSSHTQWQQQHRQKAVFALTSTPTSHHIQHRSSVRSHQHFQRQPQQPSHGIFSDTFVVKDVRDIPGSWTEGKDIAERGHHGSPLSFPISMSCDVCKKRFGFTRNAFECRDCKLRFHRQCQSLAPLPCIPKAPLPASPAAAKQQKRSSILIDYCSASHPYIPSLIIHCTLALERGEHLDREGIYRISGTVSSVTKLLNDFLSSRVCPDLTNIPTENITGCIKKFFKELRDSVVPSNSYETFIQAIKENNEQQIISAVFELPAPNRDTLAFLILHLQKVAKYSSKNKMPIENLARVLAPTLIGYSKKVPYKIAEEYTINCNQTMILFRLLKLPAEFWSQFLENNISPFSLALEEAEEEKTLLTTATTKAQSASTSSQLKLWPSPSSPAAASSGGIRAMPSSLSNFSTATTTSPPSMFQRSFSSRQRRGQKFGNNNWNKREVQSEGSSPPPKPSTSAASSNTTSPLMRSLSLASSLVRSFKSAF